MEYQQLFRFLRVGSRMADPVPYFIPGMRIEQAAFPHRMVHFPEPGYRNDIT